MIVTVHDGAGCVGGNKIHVEVDGKGLMLDFGANFGEMGRYYESFIAPRPGRGLHDYLRMGLVPRLDIYRPAYLVNDIDLTALRRAPLDALLISHAHLDHIGLAGLLREDVPFVCSPMTAALIKAMNEIGRFHFASNCLVCPEDHLDPGDGRVIASRRGVRYRPRQFLLTEPGNAALDRLWAEGTRRSNEACARRPLGDVVELEVEVRAFPVDHSIYGSTAYAVNSAEGWVVYTGDLRLHGRYQERTRDFLMRARSLSPRALIIEGTRVEREGDAEVTEEEVRENCLRAGEAEPGLLVADFGPRNIERLDCFLDIAEELGRTLVVTKKDAYLLDAVDRVDGAERLGDVKVFDRLRAEEAGAEGQVSARHGDKLVDPKRISLAPEEFLLCFSYPDMNDLLDVSPAGGTYIYSSSEAYTEESVFDFRRLWNWVHYFGMRAVGFSLDGDRPVFTKGYHASGHLSAEDLVKVMDGIGAEVVIPVHTGSPGRFEELSDNVIVPERGRPITL